MKNIKLLTVFLLILGCSAAFADNDVKMIDYKEIINQNAQNINHVKIGMTISDVVNLMKNFQSEVKDGILNNPWKIESKGNTEIYHYLTRRHPPFTPILENQAVPVIFVNGLVSAVGRHYLKDARK